MSETHDFEGSTHHFGPPPGLEEMVGWLHIFSNMKCNVSAWKPSPELLEILNNGGSIYLSVMSGSRMATNAAGVEVRVPIVHPCYVGSEAEVKAVVSDTGPVW